MLRDLWPAGLFVVLGLMFAVRPVVAYLCAVRSDLTWGERTYIGLVGPRGVVATALAAFAGASPGEAHGGATLMALVFLTILLTVAVPSPHSGLLARLLGVRAMLAVIAGAGRSARPLAAQLTAGGFDVVLADQDSGSVERALAEGLTARVGDVTDAQFLREIGAQHAQIAVGATDSDQSNLLFCQFVRSVNPQADAFARVHSVRRLRRLQEGRNPRRRRGRRRRAGADRADRTPVLHEALSPGGDRISVAVGIGTGLAGHRVRELQLPERVLVLLVLRGTEEIIPNGNTTLLRGDRMLFWGNTESVKQARADLVSVE
ncbi:MAG: hypothetical protein FJZ92_04295 [Chloroflexi bacterium]|nr:hypothetical protein [Chloroflexota bacterium]